MQTIISKIEQIIFEVQTKFKVPAIAIAIIGKDQIEYARGFGSISIENNQKINEHTIFALASISKSTASAGLAILVDEGKIIWTDPVRKYLPDFSLYDPFVDREIQVRDLLIHNCGLPEVSGGTIWYDSKFNRAEVVHRLRFLKPSKSFRSDYAYQNITYLVAGEVIEAISGQTWDDFIRERIFVPMGMKRTTTRLADLEKLQNYALPHAWINGRIQTIPYRNHENVGAAAAVNSSVWDWAQYVQMFLNSGEYKSNVIITPDRIKEIWSPQTCIPINPIPTILQKITYHYDAYGMGWFIRDYCGYQTITHSGGVDGMRTKMAILPDKNMGFVIFTNIEPGYPLNALYYSILDLFLDVEQTAWPSIFETLQVEYFEKKAELVEERAKARQQNTTSSLGLENYCGEYHDPKTGIIEVSQNHHQLRLSFQQSNCFQATLTHWHHDTFEIEWDESYIPAGLLTFELDQKHQPTGIKMDQPSLLDVDFSELDIKKFNNSNEIP